MGVGIVFQRLFARISDFTLPLLAPPVVPNRSFVRIPRSGEPALCTADNGTAGRIHGMNPHGEGVRNFVWEGIYPNSPAERNEKSSDRLMMM